MKNENISQMLKFLLLNLFLMVFIGCNLSVNSSAKTDNTNKTAKQSEIKTEATPKSSAISVTTVNAKLFGANLIKNSDAETGNGSGWTNPDNLKTIVYGDFGGGPYPDTPGPKNRGEKYFYANVTTAQPSAIFAQKIDTAAISEAIDKGAVNYDFGGWFGGFNGSYGSSRLKVSFLDTDGKEIGTDETAEVKESDRIDDLVLIERNKSGNMLVGTRKIEIKLEFYIREGHSGEELESLAYADNLSFSLNQKGEN